MLFQFDSFPPISRVIPRGIICCSPVSIVLIWIFAFLTGYFYSSYLTHRRNMLPGDVAKAMENQCSSYKEWFKAAVPAQCQCTDENGCPSNTKPRDRETAGQTLPVLVNLPNTELENLPNVVIRYTNRSDSDRCSLISGRRILINYASYCCNLAQELNCETGVTIGGFDMCISFSESSIDSEFKQRNPNVFREGAPPARYWIWKPYIIMKTLSLLRDDDVLLYMDSASHFIANFDVGPSCLLAENGGDIAVFTYQVAEKKHSKADAFILMNCLEEECFEKPQLTASFLLFRKTFRSLQFVSQWLTYAQDFRILGNSPSELKKESPDFIAARNDQSIVSILAKKWNIDHWPDPSQWGTREYGWQQRQLPRFHNLLNKTFINHTRYKF